MKSHESPPVMVGILPEEPGQPTIPMIDLDVEPVSKNVRTSDAPVSSRPRSARCGSIASETNLLDQMTMPAALSLTHSVTHSQSYCGVAAAFGEFRILRV